VFGERAYVFGRPGGEITRDVVHLVLSVMLLGQAQ
jgi:hypothetical protein